MLSWAHSSVRDCCSGDRAAVSDWPDSTCEPYSQDVRSDDDKLPVRMLHDRLLVSLDDEEAERRSSAGIVIPATATMGKRLAWARVVAVGGNVRTVEAGDRVLFDPEDRAEVEVRGDNYVLLRERDLHAVASERIADGQTGLYV